VDGNEEAYRVFYELYFDRLQRYLLVVTRDEEAAREALQLTLLRVARYAKRVDSEPVLWSWLTVLARSAARDESRKSRRYLAFLSRFFRAREVAESNTQADADETLLESLQANLQRLTSDEQELVQRKYFQRESVRDIATNTGQSEKAVESRLVRIRRKLKESILDEIKHGEQT
jgi:RNA polymerase sigma-70 factor (ECF subfamily)